MIYFGRHFDVPAINIWRLITDTQTWPQWGPSVRGVECRDRFIQAGSKGRVLTLGGVWVPFMIENFAPQRYWDWRVGGIPATGHRVKSRGSRGCELAFGVPAWAFPYGIICLVALRRIARLLDTCR